MAGGEDNTLGSTQDTTNKPATTSGKIDVDKLLTKKQYPVWTYRVKSHFESLFLWNDTTNTPLATALAKRLLIDALGNDFVSHIITNPDHTAASIWAWLHKEFVTVDLSSQSNTLRDLIDFDYSEATMSANKTALLTLKGSLIAAFGNVTTISIADLVNLFALVNLPTRLHTLQTLIIEQTTDDNKLTLEKLFSSLIREESTSNSTANRISSSSSSSSSSSNDNKNKQKKSKARSAALERCRCHGVSRLKLKC